MDGEKWSSQTPFIYLFAKHRTMPENFRAGKVNFSALSE